MKKTLITQDQFKIMPWKNGAGVTAQIAIQPADAHLAENNFDWRLSSARIEDTNPFSKFPGYDRLLTVLSGDGLILNTKELAPLNVFFFAGEEDIKCELIDAPVEDLGIIYRRDKYSASIQILQVKESEKIQLGSGVHFLMSLGEPLIIDETLLKARNFLKIEEAETIHAKSESYPCHLLKVSVLEKSLRLP